MDGGAGGDCGGAGGAACDGAESDDADWALDTKPTPTGRIVVDFLNRKFPAYVDTGLNLVDVDEVARMHLVALERGRPGSGTFWAERI